MAEGEEARFLLPLSEAEGLQAYDPAIEACLCPLHPQASRFYSVAGRFASFFADDHHCPGQLWVKPADVKKLIAKVPVG